MSEAVGALDALGEILANGVLAWVWPPAAWPSSPSW